MKDPRYWRWWLGLLLFAAACLFAPVLRNEFVYDDQWYIVQNPAIRRIQPLRFFAHPTTAADPATGLQADVYRPLLTTAFALQFQLWGLKPGPYHAVNLLLHLLNGLLLALLLRRWLDNPRLALIGAAIFLLHPVQVQSVAWVTQQSNTLALFLSLLALWFYFTDLPSAPRLTAAGAALAAALFVKEHAVVVPLFAVLIGLWQRHPKAIRRAWPLALATVLYLFCRGVMLPQWSQVSAAERDLFADLTTGLLAFPVYIGKLIAPVALRVSYRYPDFHVWNVLGSIVVWCSFLGAIGYLWRRARTVSAGLAWIVIGLLPVLQILPIRAFLAERFLYFSLPGLSLIVAGALMRFARARWVVAVWLVFLTLQTARALPAWRSEKTLWENAVWQDADNAFAWASLADIEQDREQAVEYYHRALLLRPQEPVAFSIKNNLAWLLLRKPDLANAQFWAEQARQMRPDHPAPLYNLFMIHIARKDRRQAQQIFDEVARRFPENKALLDDLRQRLNADKPIRR